MLGQIFTQARTHSFWQQKDVSEELLMQIYDLAKMGPTSANACPMRIVFVKSPAEKERLKSCLMPGNYDKTMSAPVTAIIGYDLKFYEKFDVLFPSQATEVKSWFEGNDALIKETAFRNSALQGAYFMLAARALGLDCGPMSGFDPQKINETFFIGTTYEVNFLCNLGYGNPAKLFPRLPRFDFDDVCKVI